MSELAVRDRSGIQVIARAAEILRALEPEDHGLSLSQIAERTHLARSTVQRIVGALLDEQFVIPASDRGRVKLGPSLAWLGAAATDDTSVLIHANVEELSRKLHETVDLSVLQRDRAVFVFQAASSHRLAAISQVGTQFPLHSTANGKALLACLEAPRLREVLSGKLSRDTPNTRTGVEEIEQEVEEIRRSGVAYDMEEHTPGICAVGVAFMDAFKRAYAVSVPVPKTRFEPQRAEIVRSLLATRSRIVEKIGGCVPPQETRR